MTEPSHKNPPKPCAIVIFGANGDLTRRLIVPALYNLAKQGLLPERLALIGLGHSDKGMDVWRQPLTSLRAPILVDLLADPFENAFDNAPAWEKWYIDRAFLILPAVEKVANYMATYKDFPQRQRPSSFSIDQVMEKIDASVKAR